MSEEREVISTGNEELDLKLAGGLPFPSLIIIEGEHGTGKSVVAQQFVYGALKSCLRVIAVVTEATTKGYVKRMITAGFPVLDYFIRGKLTIFSTQIPGISWEKKYASKLLLITSKIMMNLIKKYDVFLVDSLSHLATYASSNEILGFFTIARQIVDQGKLIIITLHPGTIPESLSTRIRAMADGYFKLRNAVVGGRAVKIMSVVKLKGAPTIFDSNITFDVDPAFGVKLVPIALAKA